MEDLILVENQIIISTPAFSRGMFFGSGMGVCISLGEKFVNLVVPEIKTIVPYSWNFPVVSHDLMEPATDKENLAMIGEKKLFTPNEWAKAIYFGFKVENEFFKTNPNTNVSYLELGDGERLAVYARFEKGIWFLGANPIDDKRREDFGRRIFYRGNGSLN